jgi:hypothetical protein
MDMYTTSKRLVGPEAAIAGKPAPTGETTHNSKIKWPPNQKKDKKRGGLTRPHFFPIPCVPFHRPDESHPAMSFPLILEGRVCPSTQPEY